MAVLLLVCGGASLFYLYIIQHVGSAEPKNLEVPTPSAGELGIAKLQWQRLKAAIAENREETIEFTATDLNALLAQEIEFAQARGRVRFAIADSSMTIELVAPMHWVPPGFKQRWIQTAWRFILDYKYQQFSFEILEMRTSGRKVPDWLLTPFTTWFKSMVEKRFRDDFQKKPATALGWKHIKTIAIDHDRLIVITQKI
jgi:hypothetical protein